MPKDTDHAFLKGLLASRMRTDATLAFLMDIEGFSFKEVHAAIEAARRDTRSLERNLQKADAALAEAERRGGVAGPLFEEPEGPTPEESAAAVGEFFGDDPDAAGAGEEAAQEGEDEKKPKRRSRRK